MANTNSSMSPLSGVASPSYWKDLTVEEKLERIREQVKFLQSQEWQKNSQISEINGKLANHDHKDGKVIVPMNPYGTSLGLTNTLSASKTPYGIEREAKGEVYF